MKDHRRERSDTWHEMRRIHKALSEKQNLMRIDLDIQHLPDKDVHLYCLIARYLNDGKPDYTEDQCSRAKMLVFRLQKEGITLIDDQDQIKWESDL